MLAVYLCVCQHCDHLTRRRRSWSLCWPSTWVSVNIVITSRGEEGAGRCAGRLPECLSTLWSPHEGKKELVAVLAVYLSVCQHCDHLTRRRRSWSLCWPSTWVSVNIVITSRGEEGIGRCAGRLPVCLSTLWSSHEEKKELVAVLAVYLCVCLTLWSPHEGKKELVAVLAIYLCVCQHFDHLTRGKGAGRCAGRLPVCLSNIVITSRGEEGIGRCAGRLPECLSALWSPHEGKKELVAVQAVYLCVCLTLWSPHEGKKELVAVLAVYLRLTLWSPHEGKKELVAVLAVYLSVCQHCDHLMRGWRSWWLCRPSTWVSVNIVITSRGEEEAGRCAGRLPECLSTLWSPHEGKKELVTVLAVYLCVCQHCDHLTRGRRSWSLCRPSTCVSV